jgi:hypothetical protein
MRNYNLVFGLARSEYFKWWAVDDLCAPTFFERCVEALDRNPAAVLAYSHAASIDAAGDVTSHYETYLGWAGLSPRPQVRFSRLLSEFLATEGLTAPIYLAGLFRRRALAGTRLLGNYIGADLTLVSELALAGTLVEVPEPLTSIRAHEGSSSTGEATSRPEAMHEFINPGLGGRLAVLHTRARRFPAFVEVILRSSLGLPARLTLAAHTIWTLAGYILVHYSPLGLG